MFKKLFANIIKKYNFPKLIFYFLLNLQKDLKQFKININTKCLVLSQYPGAETKGLGGLIAQFPKNFEVLCFTNGSNLIKDVDSLEAASIKKQQFIDVMKNARVKGSKVFDIDNNALIDNYSTFRKIDISEMDYIFIPNIYDSNPDTIALLTHFKNVLKEKDYKKDLKIVMFESDSPLCTMDYFVNISSIIETKKRMLKEYYDEDLIERIVGINAYRSINFNGEYAEVFMSFSVEEFLNIPMV